MKKSRTDQKKRKIKFLKKVLKENELMQGICLQFLCLMHEVCLSINLAYMDVSVSRGKQQQTSQQIQITTMG